MGNDKYSDFDSLLHVSPPDQYDTLIHDYLRVNALDPSSLPSTPWTNRATSTYSSNQLSSVQERPKKTGRKYKSEHQRYRPVPSFMPDPAAQIFKPIPILPETILPTHPIPYEHQTYNPRITRDRMNAMLAKSDLSPFHKEEIDLLVHVILARSNAFAFDITEKGLFNPAYYPDYIIPTIEHTPWQRPPMKLPRAVVNDVREEIRRCIAIGKFEPTVSSYRSPLFTVAKKPGSKPPIRLILNVEELNAVTVRDSSLPPNINDFAESFAGYSVYFLGDLFSGFDACMVDQVSRPLQAFSSIEGALQQTTLVQGYTNSIQEFMRRVLHALKNVRDEGICDTYIDDCGVRGPPSRYNDEPIDDNERIRKFWWIFVQRIDKFLAALIAAGITISGYKAILATLELSIAGSLVALAGWIIPPDLISKVLKWPIPINTSEVRMFLGLAGGARRWIRNYAIIAKPLSVLLRDETPFEITDDVVESFEHLKKRLTTVPILIRIDYDKARFIVRLPRSSDEGLLVLGVDSSWMGAGWSLYQVVDGVKKPAMYGSCTFNATQQNYGQPKSEVFGVFCALKDWRHRIWGVHFCLEHDAVSLAKMLRDPDDVPNAPMLRWIHWIGLFDFETRHVPASSLKAEDALSRTRIDTEYPNAADDAEEFLDAYDIAYGSRDLVPASERSPTALTKFVLQALQIKHSNPFLTKWDDISCSIPVYRRSQAQRRFDTISYDMFCSILASDCYSLVTHAALRNVQIWNFRRCPEARPPRKVVRTALEYLYEGETIVLETYVYGADLSTVADMVSDPCTGPLAEFELHPVNKKDSSDKRRHVHGVRDRDGREFWDEIIEYLQSERYPKTLSTDTERLRFLRRTRQYRLRDGRLWSMPKANSGNRPRIVVIDVDKRQKLIAQAHVQCGHRGRDATYKLLVDRFYWPNLYDDVSWFVRSCIECQKMMVKQPVLPYNESTNAPLLRHFDLDTIKMPTGVGNVEYIIHAIERNILWPEARAIKAANAKTVAKFIYEDIICRYSCVPVISMDGGSEFQGEVIFLLRSLYNCTVIISTPYHPQGNAPIERAHQPLVSALFKLAGDAKGNWPLFLCAVLFAIRMTVSRATGFSPYFLLYGQQPVFSFDLDEVTWQILDWDKVETFEDLILIRARQITRRNEKMVEALKNLKESRRRAIEDLAKRSHFKFDFADYEEGMYVWLRESRLDEIKGGKGEWTYAGPYVIHKKRRGGDTFELRELSGAVMRGSVSIHRLRLFYFRPENQTLRSKLSASIEVAADTNGMCRLDLVYEYRAKHGLY